MGALMLKLPGPEKVRFAPDPVMAVPVILSVLPEVVTSRVVSPDRVTAPDRVAVPVPVDSTAPIPPAPVPWRLRFVARFLPSVRTRDAPEATVTVPVPRTVLAVETLRMPPATSKPPVKAEALPLRDRVPEPVFVTSEPPLSLEVNARPPEPVTSIVLADEKATVPLLRVSRLADWERISGADPSRVRIFPPNATTKAPAPVSNVSEPTE
jgi:hypothetical protein